MDTLAQIYKRHSGGTKFNDRDSVHSYIEVYEDLFAPYRSKAVRVLEIGLFDGHSLRMWEEYFSLSEVHGVDISDQPLGMKDLRPMIAEGTHNISIFNATDHNQFEKRFPIEMFQVIIDDASHTFADQIAIYENCKDHLNGIYVIEDVQEIDVTRNAFERLGFRIIDRRGIKGRYDDVLAVLEKK